MKGVKKTLGHLQGFTETIIPCQLQSRVCLLISEALRRPAPLTLSLSIWRS